MSNLTWKQEVATLMETRLKTLKDINIQHCEYTHQDLKDDIRDAARDWIEELEKDEFPRIYTLREYDGKNPNSRVYLDEDYESSDIRGVLKWIKHFFNLGEN